MAWLGEPGEPGARCGPGAKPKLKSRVATSDPPIKDVRASMMLSRLKSRVATSEPPIKDVRASMMLSRKLEVCNLIHGLAR